MRETVWMIMQKAFSFYGIHSNIHHILSTLSYDIQGSGRNISYKQFILTV